MNLKPPLVYKSFEDFTRWLEDLYEFLKYPVFHLLKLVPRSTAPTAEEGLIYYDSDINALMLYDGTRWRAVLTNYLGIGPIQKDVTFSNSTGTVSLYTITGDVVVQIVPVITTDVTSAASGFIRLGVTGNTDSIIVDSLSTDLDARGIWVDQTPDNEIEPLDRIRSYIITDGNDIFLTLSAQIDAGAMSFYLYWEPLSTNGNV